MASRFFAELTAADVATLINAIIGFLAVMMAPIDYELAARLLLLAAVADGVDGILARQLGGSDIGPYLDSLADVASFAVGPAALAYFYLYQHDIRFLNESLEPVIIAAVASIFMALAVLRLGVYSTYDTAESQTVGAPTTLAGTIIAVSLLTLHDTPDLVLIGTAFLAICMVAPINYPDLLARDAVIMGAIHVLAVLFPFVWGRVFPYALLTLALMYLFLSPWLYWGESERRLREPTLNKGKTS